jgi:hypothetical protein
VNDKQSVTCIGGPLDGEVYNTSCPMLTTVETLESGENITVVYRVTDHIARVEYHQFRYITQLEHIDELCTQCFKPSIWEAELYWISELEVVGPRVRRSCQDGCHTNPPEFRTRPA